MKNKRCFVVAFVVIIFIFSGCINSPRTTPVNSVSKGTPIPQKVTMIKGDSVYYDNLEALSKKADWVIKGKMLKSRVERIATYAGAPEDRKEITTIYTVEVDDVYKGDISAGETIELFQTGGEIGTEKWIYEDAADIQSGQEYALFLNKSRLYANSAWLTNQYQSIYVVDGNEFVKQEINSLDLTYDVLTNLQEEAK